jgi:hypothetical protein
MTGVASGRELQCEYDASHSRTLWPTHKWCVINSVDFSAKFETEKHSFSFPGSSALKSETSTFKIWNLPQLDFIPLDTLTELPNVNELIINSCKLPILKSGLFKQEFQKIEFLNLQSNEIELIEAEAFQYLIKLKWIGLNSNKIKILSYRLFNNNSVLIYINLNWNQIASIHPNFFDGLQKLKLIDFSGNGCTQAKIGCSSCQITQSNLRGNLQDCFDNCLRDTICLNSHLAQEILESSIDVPITTDSSLEPGDIMMVLEGIDEKFLNMTEDLKIALTSKIESENEAMQIKVEKCCKSNHEAIEKINCNFEKNRETANELLTKLQKKQMEMELQNLKRENDFEAKIAAIQGKLDEIEKAMQP